MKTMILGLVALSMTLAPPALAHSGGTDRNGCHVQRSNGTRHCHGGGSTRSAPAPARALGLRSAPARGGGGGGAFPNCSAARTAGAAPVRRGEPGYGQHLDRDGDGVGCER